MKISELGQKVGVDVSTIRHYEREGLLTAPGRAANGYRAYGSEHVERLAFVRHCRALEMPLADIRLLLSYVGKPTRDCAEVNDLVDDHLIRVRARIKSMRALEKQLAALRAQCQSNQHARSCGILHELVAAAHGEACACHAAQ